MRSLDSDLNPGGNKPYAAIQAISTYKRRESPHLGCLATPMNGVGMSKTAAVRLAGGPARGNSYAPQRFLARRGGCPPPSPGTLQVRARQTHHHAHGPPTAILRIRDARLLRRSPDCILPGETAFRLDVSQRPMPKLANPDARAYETGLRATQQACVGRTTAQPYGFREPPERPKHRIPESGEPTGSRRYRDVAREGRYKSREQAQRARGAS